MRRGGLMNIEHSCSCGTLISLSWSSYAHKSVRYWHAIIHLRANKHRDRLNIGLQQQSVSNRCVGTRWSWPNSSKWIGTISGGQEHQSERIHSRYVVRTHAGGQRKWSLRRGMMNKNRWLVEQDTHATSNANEVIIVCIDKWCNFMIIILSFYLIYKSIMTTWLKCNWSH